MTLVNDDVGVARVYERIERQRQVLDSVVTTQRHFNPRIRRLYSLLPEHLGILS